MNVNSMPVPVQGMPVPVMNAESFTADMESDFYSLLSHLLPPLDLLVSQQNETEPNIPPIPMTEESDLEIPADMVSVLVMPSIQQPVALPAPPIMQTETTEIQSELTITVSKPVPQKETMLLHKTDSVSETPTQAPSVEQIPIRQDFTLPAVAAKTPSQPIPVNTENSPSQPQIPLNPVPIQKTGEAPTVPVQQHPLTKQNEPAFEDTVSKTAITETMGKTQQRTRHELESILGRETPEGETQQKPTHQKQKTADVIQPQQTQATTPLEQAQPIRLKTVEMPERATLKEAVQMISAKIQQLKTGETELIVRLDPEELGEIVIKLVSKDGKVQVDIQTQTQQAQTLLSGKGDEIASTLKESPIQLERYQVVQTNQPQPQEQHQTMDTNARGQQQNPQPQNPRSDSQKDDVEFDFESLLASAGIL